ncbi:hypothetical protein ABPG74_014521 [Tetrahymena malaccensis]
MWSKILLNPSIKLENSRAILTHISLDHLKPLSEIGLDPRIWTHNPSYCCDTEEKLKIYIQDAIKSKQDFTRVSFAVFDKKLNKYGGSSSFYAISEPNKRIAIGKAFIFINQIKDIFLGYTWYGIDFQRTGLNASVKSIMYDIAFNTLGCNRVEFHTDANNAASRAQIQHYGAQLEGIFRKHIVRHNGMLRDTANFSILSHEYAQQRDRLHID